MCLTRVKAIEGYEWGDETEHTGWKVFDTVGNRLFNWFKKSAVPSLVEGKWLSAQGGFVGDNDGEYPAGFHINISRRGAASHIVYDTMRRVKFRKIICTGYEGCYRVVVADEMMVLPEGE